MNLIYLLDQGNDSRNGHGRGLRARRVQGRSGRGVDQRGAPGNGDGPGAGRTGHRDGDDDAYRIRYRHARDNGRGAAAGAAAGAGPDVWAADEDRRRLHGAARGLRYKLRVRRVHGRPGRGVDQRGAGYVGGSASVTGAALLPALDPTFGLLTRTGGGFTAQLESYDTNYAYAESMAGSATSSFAGHRH
ncbi:hypothetical protein ScalyP_jg4011 [Parmales sp. scaly parma]|nr:hypothetical protein ScalyP_jg4011 [Parmales sp. scaly parma]